MRSKDQIVSLEKVTFGKDNNSIYYYNVTKS